MTTTLEPTIVIYWADSRQLLTHDERMEWPSRCAVESVTPYEVLLRTDEQRVIVIRSVLDRHTPTIPNIPVVE